MLGGHTESLVEYYSGLHGCAPRARVTGVPASVMVRIDRLPVPNVGDMDDGDRVEEAALGVLESHDPLLARPGPHDCPSGA
jgi:hypothetical protein